MIHPTRFNGHLFRHLTIGLLGGSFNPAHEGHLEMSLIAQKRLRLDQVWWIVSPQNPLKNVDEMAPFEKRVSGARAFLKKHPRLLATDIEAATRTRFTIDTLRALKRSMPRARFVWLMGADNLQQVSRWRRWNEIFACLPIAVFRRIGYPVGRGIGKAGARFASAWHPLEFSSRLGQTNAPSWLILNNRRNGLSGTALRGKELFNFIKGETNNGHEDNEETRR